MPESIRKCPHCASPILAAALVCPICEGVTLPGKRPSRPVGRPGSLYEAVVHRMYAHADGLTSEVTVNGSVVNWSSDPCRFDVDLQIADESGNLLHNGHQTILMVTSGLRLPWEYHFQGEGLWAGQASQVLFQARINGKPIDSAAEQAREDAPRIPVLEWKGRAYWTENAVKAKCAACSRDYSISADVTNLLAQEQGMSGRLQRRGSRMERLGSRMSGQQTRRIAAGQDIARQQQELRDLYMLCSCPSCGSTNIMLAKP